MTVNVVVVGLDRELKDFLPVVQSTKRAVGGLKMYQTSNAVEACELCRVCATNPGGLHAALLSNHYTMPGKAEYSDALRKVLKDQFSKTVIVCWGHTARGGQKGKHYHVALEENEELGELLLEIKRGEIVANYVSKKNKPADESGGGGVGGSGAASGVLSAASNLFSRKSIEKLTSNRLSLDFIPKPWAKKQDSTQGQPPASPVTNGGPQNRKGRKSSDGNEHPKMDGGEYGSDAESDVPRGDRRRSASSGTKQSAAGANGAGGGGLSGQKKKTQSLQGSMSPQMHPHSRPAMSHPYNSGYALGNPEQISLAQMSGMPAGIGMGSLQMMQPYGQASYPTQGTSPSGLAPEGVNNPGMITPQVSSGHWENLPLGGDGSAGHTTALTASAQINEASNARLIQMLAEEVVSLRQQLMEKRANGHSFPRSTSG